ncbi:MAG: hypothetical protein AB8G18_02810 [Gammaproteobacteria bacterium]
MHSNRIDGWLNLIASLGVLIGIALVIFELNLSRQAIQAQTRTELSNTLVQLLSENMGDGGYAELLHKGNIGEPLSDVEMYQYWRHRAAMIEYSENVFYQYEQGLFSDAEFTRQVGVMRRDLSAFPGFGRSWCDMQDRISPGLWAAVLDQSNERLCDPE